MILNASGLIGNPERPHGCGGLNNLLEIGHIRQSVEVA